MSSGEKPLVQLIGIGKRYGTGPTAFDALHHVDLSINAGEFVAIMGPSGSGKSTTMNIIGALDTPTRGQYLFNGFHVEHFTRDQRALLRRQYLGFVFQGFNLLPRTSAIENVELPLLYRGEPAKVRHEMALEALDKVGLTQWKDHTPAELSGGQQQRVAIARALATNPKIILCDEATSALDPTTTTSILNLLREINRKMGITIVIITHEMSVVESTCTHVAIIDDGQLAECGTVESVFSQPKSAAAKKLIFRTAGADSGAMGERMIRIVFEGSSADEPTISDLAMQCHVAVNIRYADTREVSGKLFGQMILQLPEDHLQQEKAIYFLQNKGLRVEEVNGYVHG